MAGKTYREVSCRDAGADCDFMVRAETEEEILRIVADHACRSHNVCEFSPEMKAKVSSQIKTVTLQKPAWPGKPLSLKASSRPVAGVFL